MNARGLVRPTRQSLSEGWSMRRTEPGRYASPAEIDWGGPLGPFDLDGVCVPATVASALRAAGRLEDEDAALVALGDLDRSDFWWRTEFAAPGEPAELHFDGLATESQVWLNGERLLESSNMFAPTRLRLPEGLDRTAELVIVFRGLGELLARKKPRARWRTRLVRERGLRWARTSLFGRMPSWCPPVAPVGPWGTIECRSSRAGALVVERAGVNASISSDGAGEIEVVCTIRGTAREEDRFWIDVEGARHPLTLGPGPDGTLSARGVARVPGVEQWWPHTHLSDGATPRRYSVALVHTESETAEFRVDLDPLGFRTIQRAPGERFALVVNGERIFCRGTCWTPIDAFALHADEAPLRTALTRVRDAGANMLRVTGTVAYESDAFYRICDELGILVWQDFMFATLDYPVDDDAFFESVRSEVDAVLDRLQGRACIAVLCGSSEGEQQPAMLGLAPEDRASRFFDDWLPKRCAARRPDVPFWSSTPSGGELPFHTRVGTSHYFGVGAYLRPYEDVAVSRPAFATECLAFSNPPGVTGADTTPEERIPRDRGSEWNFRDVTRHYRSALFANVREEDLDAETETALERAALANVMETTTALLRDPALDCGGALVLAHRDPWRCAGWGVLGHDGAPKSSWYALARAWAPVAVSISDDGLNGVRVHVTNDRPEVLTDRLFVALMRVDGTIVESSEVQLEVPPRGHFSGSVDALIGSFVDSSHAYRFGPPAFDVAIARLSSIGRCTGREAIHVPRERGRLDRATLGLTAAWDVDRVGDSLALIIHTESFAQFLTVEAGEAAVSDNFFHLAPGFPRRIAIDPDGRRACESIRVEAVNGLDGLDVRWPEGASA